MKPQRRQDKPGASIQVSHTQTSFYSGKLPPPEMMAQYNQVDPTFADRILSMAETEQNHIHKVEKTQLRTGIIMASLGMICGIVALGVLCYLLYYSVEKENTTVGVAITAILAGVIAIFVLRKRPKNKE